MVHLKVLENLERLRIASTQVDDEGLKHLHGLSKLKEVKAMFCSISEQGVEDLKKAIPDVEVEY